MQASVGWKWKAVASRHRTGCSTCKSSRQAAFTEWGWPLPHNSVECGKFNGLDLTNRVCVGQVYRDSWVMSGVTGLGGVYQSLTSRNRVATSTAVCWRVGFTGRIAGQHLI